MTNTITEPTSTTQANSPQSEPLLEVAGLQVEFATAFGRATVVSDATFSVRKGQTLGLVGESGSGKSVTCFAVTGLIPDPPGRVTGGSARFCGRDLIGMPGKELREIRGNDIGMVFQEPMTSLNPSFSVGEQIAESVRHHWKWNRRKAWDRAVEMLELVGIPRARDRAKSYPHEFSGGMRQRVMIAMALACDPKLLIADEPTTALDVTIQAQILDLIRRLRDELGMGVLLITHDLGVVADSCDDVAVMYAGETVEHASAHDLFSRPRHPYTEGLLRSMPSIEGRSSLWSIEGAPPPAFALPAGCRFHPRCEYATDACARPQTVPYGPDSAGRNVRCLRSNELELRGTD